MEAEPAIRFRSRILREMNANRNNPFNSPPSSTGSHGTVSPTLSSVFSEPEGESTRRLNEDIARITGAKKLPVNWEAAHRKWPEFYSKPKAQMPDFDDTDLRPLSSESKENRPPLASGANFADDSTQDIWHGSTRTRAEMQPRVDNESDMSSILGKSPARDFSMRNHAKNNRTPSHLNKVHFRSQSTSASNDQRQSLADALERMGRKSASPRNRERQEDQVRHSLSPHLSSAKSSLTAVPPSPGVETSPGNNTSRVRSFFMPDVSHLGDFVTGTLRFSGSVRNGVPIFVKKGKVIDQEEKPVATAYADVDGFEIPEDEEKIFVSMDMIREEIVSLQEHYDKVQDYASNLQHQVESLEGQLKNRGGQGRGTSERPNEHLMAQKNRLENEVATLQARLEKASRKISVNEIETESLTHEKDRAVRKLQEACEDINKLTRKLSIKEKELENSNKQLGTNDQTREDNDTLRRDLVSLKHTRDSLELENESLRADNEALKQEHADFQEEADSLRSDNESLRRQHQSLISENRSLRSDNKALREENEDLRENLDTMQHELNAAREQIESLQQENEAVVQEKTTLQEDNNSLVRHNEKYFSENKVLRRENSGFERSMHDLHDENQKLKDEIEFLKQQLDHCRPIPNVDVSGRVEEETEENMTSAYFVPDITMERNAHGQDENTEEQPMPPPPEFTMQSNQLSTIPDGTEEQTRNTTQGETLPPQQRQKVLNKPALKSSLPASSKVAFSIPGASVRSSKSTSNLPNQGSKRQSTSRSQLQQKLQTKRASFPGFDPLGQDDTTEGLDTENLTQNLSELLDDAAQDNDQRQTRLTKTTSQSHNQRRNRSQSRPSTKRTNNIELTTESHQVTNRDSCPALSNDARRVLDGLCEHNCHNCIVCCRITSHRGVVSSAEAASGKKRVAVPRPVPVTDRELSTEDPTMRPAQSPGHALALVIKGLEDEAQHMQLELSRMQARYNGHDKALGRRERLSLAEGIRSLLRRLEVKNDQIYSLYDVLEGQKAAGQAMTEEEVEMTVINITGMTIRDVTSASEQITWEGIPDLEV